VAMPPHPCGAAVASLRRSLGEASSQPLTHLSKEPGFVEPARHLPPLKRGAQA